MEEQNRETIFSVLLVGLMRGIVSREDNPGRWQHLLQQQGNLRDYLSRMALDLVIFEDEGFAFLRNRDRDEDENLPRLISRRPLSYPVSLLLALLRQKMAEHDAGSGEVRIVLDKQDVIDLMGVFFPSVMNEVQFARKVGGYLKKAEEMGFIRQLGEDTQKIEIKRILKSFVDAQWLNELELRLREYADHAGLPNSVEEDE